MASSADGVIEAVSRIRVEAEELGVLRRTHGDGVSVPGDVAAAHSLLLTVVQRALAAGADELADDASRELSRIGSAPGPSRACTPINFRFPTAVVGTTSSCGESGDVIVSLSEIKDEDGELSGCDDHTEGNVIWTAAVALAMLTSLGRISVFGESVLELGAGCGINGIVATRMGCRSCALTEIDDRRILRNLETNVARNATAQSACTASVHALDWRNLVERGLGVYSRILAADCILCAYDSATLLPRVLSRFLAVDGLAFLSMRVRGGGSEDTLDSFLENIRDPALSLTLVSITELSSTELAEAEAGVVDAECCDRHQSSLLSARFYKSGVLLITIGKVSEGSRDP